MIRSLFSGISGMQQFQQRMDVIGNNIANVNTTGFKSGRVDFADAFSQTYRGSSPGNGSTTSNTMPIQVGTGVTTAAIKNIYTQGAITRTGPQTDLALSGEGFYVVTDAVTGSTFATRAGDFRSDENGYLITNNGLRVQGYSDAALTTIGDIRIDPTGAPATADPLAIVASFTFSRTGTLNVRLSDGTEFVRGQVLLQKFKDPQALLKEGNNLYSSFTAAGPLAALTIPGDNGTGIIEAGALELSNVDLANEFTTMITTQRAFQAAARVITTSDEMLQELVNLKR